MIQRLETGHVTREQVGGSWDGIGKGTVLIDDGKGGYRVAQPHEIPPHIAALSQNVKDQA